MSKVELVASSLGMSPQTLRVLLQQNQLPEIGKAVKTKESGNYFYIFWQRKEEKHERLRRV